MAPLIRRALARATQERLKQHRNTTLTNTPAAAGSSNPQTQPQSPPPLSDLEQARRDVEASNAAQIAANAHNPLISAQIDRVLRKGPEPNQSVTQMSFGQQPTTSGGGAGAGNTTDTSGSGTGLFGSTTNTPASNTTGSLFGSKTNTTTPSAPGSLFANALKNDSSSGAGGLFGSKPSSGTGTPSIFAQQPTPQSTSEKPLFGAVTGGAGSGGNIFGAFHTQSSALSRQSRARRSAWKYGDTNSFLGSTPTPSTGATSNPFGGAASTAGNTGGWSFPGSTTPQANKTAQPSTTPAGNPPVNLFGSSAAAAPANPSNIFGAKTPLPTPPAGTGGGGLFAGLGQGQTPAGTSGAGTPATTTQPTSGAGLFAGGGGFKFPGAAASSTATTQPAAAAATTSSFGGFSLGGGSAAATSQPASTSSAAAPSMFSMGGANQNAAPAASSGAAAPSMFSMGGGNQNAAPAASSAAPAGGMFANLGGASSGAAAPASTAPAGGLFSGLGASNAPAQGGEAPKNLFGNLGTSTGAAPASTAAPATGGGLFGNLGGAAPAKTNETGSGLFGNLGAGSAAAGGTTTAPAPAGGFPAPAKTGEAPKNLFGSLGGGGASTTTAPAAATTQTAAASTSGPAPPTQSRLANKTMDEILTTWSTSLAAHQKTFQGLATRVSEWDRVLVGNSGTISTLYGRCFQAERDCAEVERQLGGVEGAQDELEGLLGRYEGEVERMLESAGVGGGEGGLGMGQGGVDGERERTYKTAEACSERLGEMHHSLADMIEEINAAGSKLGSGSGSGQRAQQQQRQDDPLAEIVRVLNGHLSQLQSIDVAASELQGRVKVAQRETRGLEGRVGEAGGWVEGFGRSYLGRR
ncbi:FG-nucleoporin nsp1 [Elasticomyces elasticus]|nr:FG-nucleoporin nsp1 [Elasticomyces elasticus]KAK3621302.1 FG-nucleoporin nsp1 [Elasticomyces elasticus]KAK4904872.1 FG-nucleoporin nsp1 [Elasticomyces elasticus]KAK5741026.1 FG-nucleoporin nsp1 [Elasticomyces elasticus]